MAAAGISAPMESSSASASSTRRGRRRVRRHLPPTDLLYKGRPVAKETVLWAFLAGVLVVAFLGVAINYELTQGVWVTQTDIAGGATDPKTGDQSFYLTAEPYDLVTGGILVLSLILIGAGFLRHVTEIHVARAVGTTLVAVAFALVLLAQWGVLGDFILAWLALGVAIPFIVRTYVEQGARAYAVRAIGFVVFGLYWATQAMRMYTIEGGDFVNAAFALFAVPFYGYFAYHEVLSYQRKETPRALLWLAGTSFITTGVYFVSHKIQVISEWLILRVAEQTAWLLHVFGQDVVLHGGTPPDSRIYYPTGSGILGDGYFPVQIILACTAIQSIMIFVGGIMALRPPAVGDGVSGRAKVFNRLYHTFSSRRNFAYLLTIPLIYVLNLLRNVLIIWMSGQDQAEFFRSDGGFTQWICSTFTDCRTMDAADNYAAFWFSHNVLGKGGSLVAMIIIAFIVFKILPELFDSIIGLVDLKDRRGPLERAMSELLGGKKGGGAQAAAAPLAPGVGGPPPSG
jgi:archaeosortase A